MYTEHGVANKTIATVTKTQTPNPPLPLTATTKIIDHPSSFYSPFALSPSNSFTSCTNTIAFPTPLSPLELTQ
jgi:hypothetical protein